MNGSLERLKNFSEENKDLLLENYKNLVVDYEDSRQFYESTIIKDKLNDYPTVVAMSAGVSVLNNSWTVAKYVLINVATGFQEYESNPYMRGELWIMDFKLLSIEPGTQFYIKALVDGSDCIADKIIQYNPGKCTCQVEFLLHGNAFNTTLYHISDCY